MNRLHKIMCIIAVCIALFSAYSLAQINVSNQISYKWYNQNQFCSDTRLFFESWNDKDYPEKLYFDVLTNGKIITLDNNKFIAAPDFDHEKELLLFVSLGKVDKRGYNIRVKEISERGNVIEVMTNLSSLPNNDLPYEEAYPYEFVKINKDSLSMKGNILFIFKDINGLELYREKYYIS